MSFNTERMVVICRANPCWLPAWSDSPLGFCRRCQWNYENIKINHLIDTPSLGEHLEHLEVCREPWFQNALLHSKRKEQLVQLLCKCIKQPDTFRFVKTIFQDNPIFKKRLEEGFHLHTGLTRDCQIYQKMLFEWKQAPKFCLNCIMWMLEKQPWRREAYFHRLCCPIQGSTTVRFFVWYIYSRGRLERFLGHPLFLEYTRKEERRQNFFRSCQMEFEAERQGAYLEWILTSILLHPLWMEEVLTQRWQPEQMCLDRAQWLYSLQPIYNFNFRRRLKRREDIWKEELIQRAWNPERFWDWCLDEEDKQDFRASR